jgi:hypothetical protein
MRKNRERKEKKTQKLERIISIFYFYNYSSFLKKSYKEKSYTHLHTDIFYYKYKYISDTYKPKNFRIRMIHACTLRFI